MVIISLYFKVFMNVNEKAEFNNTAGHVLVDNLIPGKQLKFNLVNIHAHTPSEHLLESIRNSIEIHFVHSLDSSFNATELGLDRTKLVIGVLFDATVRTKSEFIESMNLNDDSNAKLDIDKFLKEETSDQVYFYEGGLTTPTCDMVVNWFVFKKVAGSNTDQLEKFTECEHDNYRVLQELNGRPITLVSVAKTEETTNTGLYSVLAVIVACVFSFIVIFV